MKTGNPPATNEARIGALLEKMVDAARAKDIEGIMSLYGPHVRSFEFGPPLQVAGADAIRGICEAGYSSFKGPFGYELRDVRIAAGEEVAYCHGIEHITGTMNGQEFEMWSRATYCFRKIDGEWKITHQHLSVPTESGKALFDLKP